MAVARSMQRRVGKTAEMPARAVRSKITTPRFISSMTESATENGDDREVATTMSAVERARPRTRG